MFNRGGVAIAGDEAMVRYARRDDFLDALIGRPCRRR
jgi:hypothetical protein